MKIGVLHLVAADGKFYQCDVYDTDQGFEHIEETQSNIPEAFDNDYLFSSSTPIQIQPTPVDVDGTTEYITGWFDGIAIQNAIYSITVWLMLEDKEETAPSMPRLSIKNEPDHD